MLITITIVSNITLLVSHNIIFFGFYVPMSHGVNKKTPPRASPTSLSLTNFSQGLFVVLQMFDQSFFAVIRLLA